MDLIAKIVVISAAIIVLLVFGAACLKVRRKAIETMEEQRKQKIIMEKLGLKRERNLNCQELNPLSSPWIYYCTCGGKLTEGPEGGASVNAVCKPCRINYGCLPGYYGDQ